MAAIDFCCPRCGGALFVMPSSTPTPTARHTAPVEPPREVPARYLVSAETIRSRRQAREAAQAEAEARSVAAAQARLAARAERSRGVAR